MEPDVRHRLWLRRILSTRILWLEGKLPAEYPELALVAATTHDLPTIAGLWTGADKKAQLAADPRPNESMAELRRHVGRVVERDDDAAPAEIIEAAYGRLAEAPSRVIVATLEDAMAVEERPNMPGTTTQWPNWRLALPGGLEALENSSLPRQIAAQFNRTHARPAARESVSRVAKLRSGGDSSDGLSCVQWTFGSALRENVPGAFSRPTITMQFAIS